MQPPVANIQAVCPVTQGSASSSATFDSAQHVSSTFEMTANGQFHMRSGAQLHMFISQPPCGDACNFNTNHLMVSKPPENNSMATVTDAAEMPGCQHAYYPASHQSAEPSTERTFTELKAVGSFSLNHSSSSSHVRPSHPDTHNKLVTVSEPAAKAAEQSLQSPGLLSASLDTEQQAQQAQHAQHAVSICGSHPAQQRPYSPDLPQIGSRGHMKAQPASRLDAYTPVPKAIGGLCRKPGRGDATLSMSCSDKLARWSVLGVQVCHTSSSLLFCCSPAAGDRQMFGCHSRAVF